MGQDQLIVSEERDVDGESIDRYLIQLIMAGSEAALEILYNRHGDLIYSLVLRILGNVMDAEEVTQDVFLTVWAKSKSYSPSRGRVRAWITAIARNRAIDRVRSKQHKIITRQVSLDEANLANSDVGAGDDPSSDTASEGTTKIVGRALSRLSDVELKVIELAYFEGLTHSDIAARLGLPLGTVKTRLRRAVTRLRSVFGKEDDQDYAT